MHIVFYEGAFVLESEAKIPISDRGFQFGDGVFTTIQVKEGVPLFLSYHLEKLKEQCALLHLEVPELNPASVFELIRLNQAFEGVWRLKILLTGGDDPSNFLPKRRGRVLILVKPFAVPPRKPLETVLFPIPVSLRHSSFKSLAHLNRFYVMQWAKENNCDDSLTTTEKGYLLEAAFGNLFWVHQQTVYTPSHALPLYFGVTLRHALTIAGNNGYQIEPVEMKLLDLPKEASLFRTNTMGGVRPIAKIDGFSFPVDEALETLFCEGYERIIEEEIAKAFAAF